MTSNVSRETASVYYDDAFEQLKNDVKAGAKEVIQNNSETAKKILKEQVGQSIETTTPYVTNAVGTSAEAASSKPAAVVIQKVAGQSTEAVGKKIANSLIDKSVDSGAEQVVERSVDYSIESTRSVSDSVMGWFKGSTTTPPANP